MAPLQVIGASFGRTGTDSLREALNALGYKTHHMREVFPRESSDHANLFIQAYDHPEKADFDRIYEDYDAAVDWPTTSYVEPLMHKYPEAKFIFTERDFDSWYKSAMNSIFKYMDHIPPNTKSMIDRVIVNGDLKGDLHDEETMRKIYNDHTQWVKKNIPADRILYMQLGEGWDRLCEFLGKPVPDIPYPHSNTTKDMEQKVKDYVEKQQKEHLFA